MFLFFYETMFTANSICTTLYNYAGLTITKEISALTRKVLDSIRTITIWILAIIIFRQIFRWQTVNIKRFIYFLNLFTLSGSWIYCTNVWIIPL